MGTVGRGTLMISWTGQIIRGPIPIQVNAPGVSIDMLAINRADQANPSRTCTAKLGSSTVSVTILLTVGGV